MRARVWGPVLLWALVVAGAAGYVAWSFRATTAITHFLPGGKQDRVAVIDALAGSELGRVAILTVEADTPAVAREAARSLARDLADRPEVASVRSGVGPRTRDAVHAVYFPHRHHFVTDRPDEVLPEMLGPEGLRREARQLRRRLADPTGSLVRRLAPADPLLVFEDILDRLEALRSDELGVRDGVFVTEDGRHAVVLIRSRRSPFELVASERFLKGIDRAVAASERAVEGELRVEMSALHRYAVDNARTIRTDIRRVSIASAVGVLLLFLLLFRSVRSVLLVFLPVGIGILVALASSLAMYDRVHGLTLAFGATLIGVAVDYGAHLLCHHALGPPGRSAAETRRQVWGAVRLGALTTVAGFAGLGWTDFPGIREVAWFASVGVLTALVAARSLLPALMGDGGRAPGLLRGLGFGATRSVQWLGDHPWAAWAALVPAVVVFVLGVPRLTWNDSPRALQQASPSVRAEDERVRARVDRIGTGRLVAASGPDLQTALERNDAVHLALERARRAGEVSGWRSLHAALWSAKRQRANARILRETPDLRRRLGEAFEAEGFRPGAFEPFFRSLERVPPPLDLETLRRSPLGDVVGPFQVGVEGRPTVLTFLREVARPDALAERIGGIEGTVFVDREALLIDAYGRFRRRAIQLMAVGLLFVLGVLALRYRRWRPVMAAFGPAVLAASAALGVLGLIGATGNLLHAIACLLVLSIGVDYGVFVVEHRHDRAGMGASVTAILAACATTVLSFGLLAMSDNPALRAVGLTTGIGVLFALVIAPAALALLGRGETSR